MECSHDRNTAINGDWNRSIASTSGGGRRPASRRPTAERGDKLAADHRCGEGERPCARGRLPSIRRRPKSRPAGDRRHGDATTRRRRLTRTSVLVERNSRAPPLSRRSARFRNAPAHQSSRNLKYGGLAPDRTRPNQPSLRSESASKPISALKRLPSASEPTALATRRRRRAAQRGNCRSLVWAPL